MLRVHVARNPWMIKLSCPAKSSAVLIRHSVGIGIEEVSVGVVDGLSVSTIELKRSAARSWRVDRWTLDNASS